MKEIWKGVKKKKNIENKAEREILRNEGLDTWGEEKESERRDWKKKNRERSRKKEKLVGSCLGWNKKKRVLEVQPTLLEECSWVWLLWITILFINNLFFFIFLGVFGHFS